MSMSVSSAMFGSFSSAHATGKTSSTAPTTTESIETQFLKLAKQNPIERMRAAILKKMGLTEDDLKAMDPKTRAEIEKTIREEIAKQLKAEGDKSTGLLTDMAA